MERAGYLLLTAYYLLLATYLLEAVDGAGGLDARRDGRLAVAAWGHARLATGAERRRLDRVGVGVGIGVTVGVGVGGLC